MRTTSPSARWRWPVHLTADGVCTWREHLRQRDERGLGHDLHRHEATGRPLGDRAFLERLSRLLGCNLIPGKGGRPRKKN